MSQSTQETAERKAIQPSARLIGYPPVVMTITWLIITPAAAWFVGWDAAINNSIMMAIGAWGYWLTLKADNAKLRDGQS